MADRYEKDGEVAVLISPGYGAGWSTWCYEREIAEKMLFDPVLVELLLTKAHHAVVDKYVEDTYEEKCYTGGLHGLKVVWVPKGTCFVVREYDGYESLEYLGNIDYFKA